MGKNQTSAKEAELQVVNFDAVSKLGIEVGKADEIKAAFQPMLDKMVELQVKFNAYMEKVDGVEMTKELSDEAKELRIEYKDVRVGTGKIHRKTKEFYLVMGRAVDGWRNTQLAAGTGIEEALKEKENHFELLEKAKLEALLNERKLVLAPYDVDFETVDVATMNATVFKHFVVGCKQNFEIKQQAAAAAEAEALQEAEDKRIYGQRKEALLPYGLFIDIQKLGLKTTEEEFNALMEAAKSAKKDDDERVKELERVNAENEKKKGWKVELVKVGVDVDEIDFEKLTKAKYGKILKAGKEAKAAKAEEAAKQSLLERRKLALMEFVGYVDFGKLTLKTSEEEFNAMHSQAEKDQKAAAEAKALEDAKQELYNRRVKNLAAYGTHVDLSKLTMEISAEDYDKMLIDGKAAFDEAEKAAQKAASILENQQQAAAAKEEEEAKQALASGKEKLQKWVDGMEVVELKELDKASQSTYNEIKLKFAGFKKWANGEIKKMK